MAIDHLNLPADFLSAGLILQQSGNVDRVHRVVEAAQRRPCHRRHLLVTNEAEG